MKFRIKNGSWRGRSRKWQRQGMRVLAWIVLTIAVPMIITWIYIVSFGRNLYDKNQAYVYRYEHMGQQVKLGLKGRAVKLDVEEALGCLLMGYMDIDEEEEALKAMAVVLRTYIVEGMWDYRIALKNRDSTLDISDIGLKYKTYEELERQWGDSFPIHLNYLNKIVRDTSCQVLEYEENIIKPEFHMVSAGKTRPSEVPYLQSVDSEGDMGSEKYLNIHYFSKDDFAKRINERISGGNVDSQNPLNDFRILKRDQVGYVTEVQIGDKEIAGEELAEVMGLDSTYFQVEPYGDDIRIITKGVGRGYGLSIYGASVCAKKGWSYVQILQHYYGKNITLK